MNPNDQTSEERDPGNWNGGTWGEQRTDTASPSTGVQAWSLPPWTAGERTCVQLSRAYGLAPSMLYRWKHEYDQYGEGAFTGKHSPTRSVGTALTEAALVQRISALERALDQMTLENQILKKGRSLAALRSESR